MAIRGFVDSEEQAKLRECLQDISEKKPFYNPIERKFLIRVWKMKDRNFTVAEARLIYGIHGRTFGLD
ncbi:hypothetical protein KAR91_28405 [Candidatus Pacearchaeota archaeon]|nr:hypothetical protein [Candidatus Pacearchaeota archaeon]